jgi:hypothetical protein
MPLESSISHESSLPIPHNLERYNTALQIARQINAEFQNRRALKVFEALTRPEVLPVVAAVGATGVVVAGIVSALRAVKRHGNRAAKHAVQTQNRQLVVISETAIQISPVHVAIVSRIGITEQEDAHPPLL